MTKTRVSACALVVAASLAGCAGTGDVEYAGEVRVTSPDLVAIGPGVQVIADADEPIFYSSGDYWLYRDGYWFRSDDYRSGYARVEYRAVPQAIRDIDRPQRYVHYNRTAATRAARGPTMRTRSPAQPIQEPQPREQPRPEPMQQPPQPPDASTTPPANEPDHGAVNPQDRADQATPPTKTNPDNRAHDEGPTPTQELDQKKDKQTPDE